MMLVKSLRFYERQSCPGLFQSDGLNKRTENNRKFTKFHRKPDMK